MCFRYSPLLLLIRIYMCDQFYFGFVVLVWEFGVGISGRDLSSIGPLVTMELSCDKFISLHFIFASFHLSLSLPLSLSYSVFCSARRTAAWTGPESGPVTWTARVRPSASISISNCTLSPTTSFLKPASGS